MQPDVSSINKLISLFHNNLKMIFKLNLWQLIIAKNIKLGHYKLGVNMKIINNIKIMKLEFKIFTLNLPLLRVNICVVF